MPGSGRRPLLAFGAVSFVYFSYAGLFSTYAPLWFQSLGYGTLAIGALASAQSATRLFGPYAWGWFADHGGRRVRMLRIAIGGALVSAVGLLVPGGYGWVGAVTVALFICTSGVIPISDALLAQFVSRDGALDIGRYGRVRVWGSIGFVVTVIGSGALLQRAGIGAFPILVIGLLSLLLVTGLRVPAIAEVPQPTPATRGALDVLREPLVAWFFGGVFFTVLAHTGLYAFLSLYLLGLGYSKTAIGLIWSVGVAAEVSWFWFQGRWIGRLSPHAWLVVAALVTALRFALTACFGALPAVLVLLQCSHALTFAAQHSACIAVITRHFPGRFRGRGQALYAVLGYGASGVVGGLAGGALSQAWGFAAVFWGGALAGALGAGCAARAWRLAGAGPARAATV